MNEEMHNFVLFFEFVEKVFKSLGYEVNCPSNTKVSGDRRENYLPDLIATKPGQSLVVEIKYYTANSRPYVLIGQAFSQVAKALDNYPDHTGLIVSNRDLNDGRISELRKRYDRQIQYWSINDLVNRIEGNPGLIEQASYFDPDQTHVISTKAYEEGRTSKTGGTAEDKIREATITALLNELDNCPVSKGPPFEEICTKILKFVFKDQLTSWGTQNRTDNGLHKHDLVARVLNIGTNQNVATNSAEEDFWSIVSRHFNCRYITFEFKNYKKKIKQGEVLTTEKYLYLKALRSVAIIIAKNGADKNAKRTMKGALREHGKLILCLDTKDLENMLLKVRAGDDAQQLLTQELDRHLLTINR